MSEPVWNWGEFFARANAEVARQLRGAVEASARWQQSELARQIRESIQTASRDWAPVLANALRDIHEAVEQGLPPNWDHLTVPEILAVVELMKETGWSLIGTPPAEVVRDLLAASDKAEREELLLAAEPMVVVDLDRMLAGANRDEVATLRIAAGEALESYRAGYLWSAQALATAAVGSVVHGHLGYRTWTDAREAFEALDIEEQGLRRFRLGALQGSLARAITPYRPSDPPPVDYNRHASAHGVSRSQYRPVNSLAAVMLLATLTTELNTLFRLTNRGGEVD